MRNKSTGNIGTGIRFCRRMKTTPAIKPPASSAATHIQPWPCPAPSRPINNRPKVAAFNAALTRSNRWPDFGVSGSDRRASQAARTPNGTLMVKSPCQDVTARIAAARDGPAAEQVATTSAVVAMPRPNRARGKM